MGSSTLKSNFYLFLRAESLIKSSMWLLQVQQRIILLHLCDQAFTSQKIVFCLIVRFEV